jgi:hypothetical protein
MAAAWLLGIPESRASAPNKTDKGELVFHKYGDEYFLATIWTPNAMGYSIPMSRHEKALANRAGSSGLETASIRAK